MMNKVMFLSESNYALDICYTRHRDCLYLFRLALDGEIELIIPEYALAEVEAKLKQKETEWINTITAAQAVSRELSSNALREQILADMIEEIRQMIVEAIGALNELRRVATRIPFTGDILAASRLRRARRAPPHDVKDLEIYESILAFARLNKDTGLKMVFLERDAAHFNISEIKAELAAVGVEIYFSAGEAVRRVRELLGK